MKDIATRLLGLYDRTKQNCLFYERKKEYMGLVNEIGCLRGIAYCLEEVGIDPLNDKEFIRLIEIQQKIKSVDAKKS